MSLLINQKNFNSLHFVGILGIGMSAIAQFLSKDVTITGSDRGLGNVSVKNIEMGLNKLGCQLFKQDGSGVTNECDGIVVSTAIEESNPDYQRAIECNIPILHRSEVLAAIVNNHRTIAVTGTSGKSSVSAMIFHALQENRIDASYIGGANLHFLKEEGMIGNSYKGSSDILVIEADESDGSVVRYFPEVSVLLNISRDHKEEEVVEAMLNTVARQSKKSVINGDDTRVSKLPGTTFGFNEIFDFYPNRYSITKDGVSGTICNEKFTFPFPGKHSVANILATVATLSLFDIAVKDVLNALQNYRGIERRFDTYWITDRSLVIDDYAHNPEKITAAVRAAQEFSPHLTAIFQPHGFGPLKFMKEEIIETFSTIFRKEDRAYILPVYYAGGTVDRSVNSLTIAENVENLQYIEREEIIEKLKKEVREDEVIILLGARDPSLPLLAKEISEQLKEQL